MQVVTMKADRQVGNISVPSGNEAPPFRYTVRENGTVEVPLAHVPHFRGADFRPLEEIESERLREKSQEERIAELTAQLDVEKARASALEAKSIPPPKDAPKDTAKR